MRALLGSLLAAVLSGPASPAQRDPRAAASRRRGSTRVTALPCGRIAARPAPVVRVLPALCLLLGGCDGVGGCPDGPAAAVSATVLERRIAAAMPEGWSLARRAQGAVPYGFVPGPGGRGSASVALTLVGPEGVAISGYYCAQGAFCEQPIAAREAVEVWIMPAAFADAAGPPAWTTRGASLIARCHGRAIYGLVSRYAGEALDFDGRFTGASTETSRMPQRGGDLPTSWRDWERDLGKTVR